MHFCLVSLVPFRFGHDPHLSLSLHVKIITISQGKKKNLLLGYQPLGSSSHTTKYLLFSLGLKDAFFGQINIGFIHGNSPSQGYPMQAKHWNSMTPANHFSSSDWIWLPSGLGTAKPGIRSRTPGVYLPNECYFRMPSILFSFEIKMK